MDCPHCHRPIPSEVSVCPRCAAGFLSSEPEEEPEPVTLSSPSPGGNARPGPSWERGKVAKEVAKAGFKSGKGMAKEVFRRQENASFGFCNILALNLFYWCPG